MPINRWINKLDCHLRMEHHSARDVNELPTHRTAWMSPGMVLSKGRVLFDVRFKERAVLGVEEAEWG